MKEKVLGVETRQDSRGLFHFYFDKLASLQQMRSPLDLKFFSISYLHTNQQLATMWIITKKVGIFTHYLTERAIFQPGLEKANKFASQEMAEILTKKHGGQVEKSA